MDIITQRQRVIDIFLKYFIADSKVNVYFNTFAALRLDNHSSDL